MSTIDWPDGKEASLGATPRVISGVNASDGYLVDPVARHTLIVARKFLDKSPSTMGHQGIRTGSVKRHVALSENRLGISNTRPPKFLLSSIDAVCARSCFQTIKIIYSTLFQGYRHLHPREWLARKWRIMYSDYFLALVDISSLLPFNEYGMYLLVEFSWYGSFE